MIKIEGYVIAGILQLLRLPLKDGIYDVVIKRHYNRRSKQQLKYLFGVVYKMIATETGNSIDDIHNALKHMFLLDTIKLGNKELICTKSLSDSGGLTTVEMSDYIENVRAFAASELGLNIPNPGDSE